MAFSRISGGSLCVKKQSTKRELGDLAIIRS